MSFTFEDMKEKIKHGINYGNALECFDSNVKLSCKHAFDKVDDNGIIHPIVYEFSAYSGKIDELDPIDNFTVWSIESLWGNPETTKEIIQYYADSGFTAIRLPVNLWWHRDVTTGETSVRWLEYIRSVVDMVIDAGMFCLIDVHCENYSAIFKDISSDYTNLEKSKAFDQLLKRWIGLATILKDIPEDKLAFELLNEFHLGRSYNDNYGYREDCAILAKIYSKLINEIRNTGDHNVDRLIGIDGYRADNNLTAIQIDCFSNLLNDDKIFLCLMAYLMPEFTFCYNESFGKKTFLEGDTLDYDITRINNGMWGLADLVKKDYRCIVVEYGTHAYNDFTGTEEEIAAYRRGCVKMTLLESLWCNELGIPAFAWDNGNIIDRSNLSIKTPELYNAIFRIADQEEIDYLYTIMKKY